MAVAPSSSRILQESRQVPYLQSRSEMERIAQRLAMQISEQLPGVLQHLLQGGFDPDNETLELECSINTGSNGSHKTNDRLQVAAVNIGRPFSPLSSITTLQFRGRDFSQSLTGAVPQNDAEYSSSTWKRRAEQKWLLPGDSGVRPAKRRKADVPPGELDEAVASPPSSVARNDEAPRTLLQRHKRQPDNPILQPSTFEKFINGVWESIYLGVQMNPTEVIEQWQAIELSGQPKLLIDTENRIAMCDGIGAFRRMNTLTRRVSQTSRTCRSLEVIVQAHWVQCFEDRVEELSIHLPLEKARKAAINEACVDFGWTEKELRNKTAIWRGYHDIQMAGGWAALVFAGSGLYRFCKYRVSFTQETFELLRSLRHRFEVAADTIHPRWRILLGIVGAETQPQYRGHPHDWVVNGPGNEAFPLPQTYHQWDKEFSYVHLVNSTVDKEAWGELDPRTVTPATDSSIHRCQACHQMQSNDPMKNDCACYPNLYGSPQGGPVPLQVFRTPDGKNNGLIACCPFENGWAVGEFVGLITSGLAGLDVMVGETDHGMYQIWQGRQGNHTRFVNHSCMPNSHFERFVWLGKQRIVLVSQGIEPGQEITVDYGHTYWHLDKECKCNHSGCRYRDRRSNHLILAPNEDEDEEQGDEDVSTDTMTS